MTTQHRSVLRSTRGIVFLLALFVVQGCDSILGLYAGPHPQSEPLREEIVVVREIYNKAEGGIYSFFADRVRFANDPHNINRVVDVRPGEIEAALNALDLEVGDRLRISTQFFGVGEASGLDDKIPNWPYGKYLDYPIGVHLLTAIERVSP